MSSHQAALLAALIPLAASLACTETKAFEASQERLELYFATHRDIPKEIAEAIRLAHVVPGMDREQVRVVLGDPIQEKTSSATPGVEHWLYPANRFHQQHLRWQGSTLVRITFLNGRVVLIDPR